MKTYYVKQTKVFDLEMLEKVYNLDKMVYSEEMAGNIDSDSKRFKKIPESFLLLYEDDSIIGYICFFPVTDQFFKGMLSSDNLYDNNIVPVDMKEFIKTENHHIFIISMVINPTYKSNGLFRMLTKAFKKRIKAYHEDGYNISDISGYAVSGAGEHILKSFGCKLIKEIYDDEEGKAKLYIGDYHSFLREF
ncbi:MAG: GNAT family N-acetyltransferase [Candidatus Izemoplasmatales bacterium]